MVNDKIFDKAKDKAARAIAEVIGSRLINCSVAADEEKPRSDWMWVKFSDSIMVNIHIIYDKQYDPGCLSAPQLRMDRTIRTSSDNGITWTDVKCHTPVYVVSHLVRELINEKPSDNIFAYAKSIISHGEELWQVLEYVGKYPGVLLGEFLKRDPDEGDSITLMPHNIAYTVSVKIRDVHYNYFMLAVSPMECESHLYINSSLSCMRANSIPVCIIQNEYNDKHAMFSKSVSTHSFRTDPALLHFADTTFKKIIKRKVNSLYGTKASVRSVRPAHTHYNCDDLMIEFLVQTNTDNDAARSFVMLRENTDGEIIIKISEINLEEYIRISKQIRDDNHSDSISSINTNDTKTICVYKPVNSSNAIVDDEYRRKVIEEMEENLQIYFDEIAW